MNHGCVICDAYRRYRHDSLDYYYRILLKQTTHRCACYIIEYFEENESTVSPRRDASSHQSARP